MLLVMDTAGIFHTAESGYTDLWEVTWERIDIFLPNLKQELFRGEQKKLFPSDLNQHFQKHNSRNI